MRGVWTGGVSITVCAALSTVFASGAELTAEQQEQIRAIVRSTMESEGVPGITVAVVVDKEPSWSEGFGYADLEIESPATPDTIYRYASVSKMITAAGAMRLVDDGKLDLHEPIHTYLPDFPEKPWPITLHHLLSHQAGFRHWKTIEEVRNTRRYDDIASSLESFKKDPLLFEPGTNEEYSTPGFNVVGRLIEVGSGQPYAEYMAEAIFQPAGLTTTAPAHVNDDKENAAHRYMEGRDGARVSPPHDVSIKTPGGGLSGTAGDLAQFASAMMQGRLVKPETLETMWTAKTLRDGTVTNKGYGCNVGEEKGRGVVWHIGGLIGASGILYVYPEAGHAVALLTNRRASPIFPMASQIMDVIVGYAE